MNDFISRAKTILSHVSYLDWEFEIHSGRAPESGPMYITVASPYLQIVCPNGECNVTGKTYEWKGRKWMLSIHMTDSEIVTTAFKAVMTAIEHEARENFKYKGESIFDPHYDVDKLVELRRAANALDERPHVVQSDAG